MLFRRIALLLCGEHLKGADDTEACVAGFDDVIDISVLSCIIRIGEEFCVFLFLFLLECCGIGMLFGFLRIEDTNCAFGTHHCDFSSRPCIVHIATELLAAHHDVAAAIALAESDSDLRHCSFAVSIEKFSTGKDDSVVFLTCTGKESGDVDESHQRNV